MPELPEVETTRRGIAPHIENKQLTSIIVRNPNLRWKVDEQIEELFRSAKLLRVDRRAKYLILSFDNHRYQLIHLGMSGSLRLCGLNTPIEKHDHIDWQFDRDTILRLRDPRRFGALLIGEGEALRHPRLLKQGPEPLTDDFQFKPFYDLCKQKKTTIKQLIMDAKTVVGVGNIYASEALFLAGIRPAKSAHSISKQQLFELYQAIKQVLAKAIDSGGTTLKDFNAPNQQKNSQPGYFQQQLNVYGRSGQACLTCQSIIKQKTIAQRSSFYCPHCQK